MRVGTTQVDLCEQSAVLAEVRLRLRERAHPPLAIGSVNLDHLHHFGRAESVGAVRAGRAGPDWLLLADGAPVVARARNLTGVDWPRLTGADLLPTILEEVGDCGQSAAFLGGTHEVHDRLRAALASRLPGLDVAGYWAPARSEVAAADGSARLTAEIRRTGAAVLVVALGKPRQELWIDRYAADTGARVLLAFGASTDFLAGSVDRAPDWMREHGLEWSYRLAREPRRLSRRYLLQGPRAWLRLRRAYVCGGPPDVLHAVDDAG